MVHDGARVLGAGFLPPPSLPPAATAAAAAAAAREWGGSRAGLCCASGAGLAPLRPVPPRRCSRRLLLAAAAGARGLPASGRALGPNHEIRVFACARLQRPKLSSSKQCSASFLITDFFQYPTFVFAFVFQALSCIPWCHLFVL